MLITIDTINGNSGQGSPLFSRPGKHHNNEFKVFQSPLPARILSENVAVNEKMQSNDLAKLFESISLEKKKKVSSNSRFTANK